jgi:hypothetical protein
MLIRHHHLVVFGICFAMYALAAIVLPHTGYRVLPLSFPLRFTVVAVGLSTFVFAISLSFYFFDSWSRKTEVEDSFSYKVWITFETLFGVPFTLSCFVWAAMCMWVAGFK